MLQKYFRKWLFLIPLLLFGITLVACSKSSSSNSNNSTSSQTISSNTFSKNWSDGVPSNHEGYYGKDESGSFSGVTFKKDEVSFGSSNSVDLKHPEYRRLDDTTYLIHGAADGQDRYIKIQFKTTKGSDYLGIVSASTQLDAYSYKKALKMSTKNTTWYKQYTKDEFDKLNGGTSTNSNSSSSSSSQSASSDSSSRANTITTDDGTTHQAKYTLQQLRNMNNMQEVDTTEDGMATHKYAFTKYVVDPKVHQDGDITATPTRVLPGVWAWFSTTAEGSNMRDFTFVNVDTGQTVEDKYV